MIDQITTKPGKKYASIKNPRVYEALRRRGYSKQRAARISNAQKHKDDYPDQSQFAGYTMEDWDDTKPDSFYHAAKDAGTDVGAPLAGPGGLLATPGMSGRRWGNRRKSKACTCGVNIATKESLGPGITRIRGNLCNVHGRYGPCDAALSGKKKPKAGKGRKPKAPKKPKKVAQTPEQRQAARQEEHAANRKKVLEAMGIGADGQAALDALRSGGQPDAAAIERGGFVKAGLVEQAADGSYRLTASGRATLSAADAGDQGRAGDTISSARDRTGARTQRQSAAAERKRQAEERRKKAAVERAKKPSSGGKRDSTSSSAQRETIRQQREAERQADRKQRQTEHEQDRAQRQTEHAQDRALALEERRQRLAERRQQAPRVSSSRPGVTLPRRRRGNAALAKKSFTVFKSADGSYRWVARTTTAYRDRDGEIITTKALDQDAARMTATGQYGPLRYWHIGQPDPFNVAQPWGLGLDLGDCDYSIVIGRTSIESGTFKSAAIGKAFAESADEYELSPGFFHPPMQPNAAGEYDDIRRFERSVVPIKYGRASNLFTGLTVKEHRMDQQTYEARVKAFLTDMHAKGVPPDVAAASLAGMEQADKSAQQQGIAFKSGDAPQVFTAPDGTQGLIADGHFVALKAAATPEPVADKDDGEGDMEVIAEGEAPLEEGGEYVGDMTPADFFAQLDQHLAPILRLQDMHKAMGDGLAELKGMMGGVATKDAGTIARIAQLETELAKLKGDQPSVTTSPDLEAALKSTGPQAPPDPNAPQIPADAPAITQLAARTMPALYSNSPNGGFQGWQPPSQS